MDMAEDATSWNCNEFAEVLAQLQRWLETDCKESAEAPGRPRLPSASCVQQAVQAQRQHLEAILRPTEEQSRAEAAEDSTVSGTETRPSDAAAEDLRATASSDSGSAPAVTRRLQALPDAVWLVLDVLAKLWQAHEQRCKQPGSGSDELAEDLSRRLRDSECQLAEEQEERELAAERENEREMKLCRMMAQEAREAAELRESLRRSEQSAGQVAHVDVAEEKSKVQLERCQQELAKAQRRNTELLKDLKMLCTPSSSSGANAGDIASSVPVPEKPSEDQSWSLKSIFGENPAATLMAMANPLTPRSRGAQGSVQQPNSRGHVAANPQADGIKTPSASSMPRRGSKSGQASMTPRTLTEGSAPDTARGMPSSMRELAQILAPQKIVPVDQASPEARISQLQKLVRELTSDLRERDARIKKLSMELRRAQDSTEGVVNMEVLGEESEFTMQDTAPLSARGVRGESGRETGLGKPKLNRLSLPLRIAEDSFEPQPRLAAQSAR